jgi:hypothetical protein
MVGSEANGAWMMRPDNQTLQGIAYVILAAASFATLDTTTKFVSYAVPFAVSFFLSNCDHAGLA